MTAIEAAALYAAINILILLVLGLGTGLARGRHKVNFGTGGVPDMELRIRAHANAAEWIPASLVGLVILALVGAPVFLIHVLGVALSLARVAHASTMGLGKQSGPGRTIGALLTALVYLAQVIALFWYAVM